MSIAGTAPPVGGGRIAWLVALVPALAFLVGGSLWAFLAPSLPSPPAPVVAAKGAVAKPAVPVKNPAVPIAKSATAPNRIGPNAPLKIPMAAAVRASAIGAATRAVAPPVVKTLR